MEHNETYAKADLSEQHEAERSTILQELANAQREIQELQSQIQWLERSYE